MFGRHTPKINRDRLYHPIRLAKTASAQLEGLREESRRLRWWSFGLALGAPLFIVVALMIRGWQNAAAFKAIAVIGLTAFLWSYLLLRASARADVLRHFRAFLWVNTAVLLLLVSAMIGTTGASLSPLFWLYFVVTTAELLQDRRRGLLVAWISWGMFCALIVAQRRDWLSAIARD